MKGMIGGGGRLVTTLMWTIDEVDVRLLASVAMAFQFPHNCPAAHWTRPAGRVEGC